MKCSICGTAFDNGLHLDCGGDCRLCMATVVHDPDEALALIPFLLQEVERLRSEAERVGSSRPNSSAQSSDHPTAEPAMSNIGMDMAAEGRDKTVAFDCTLETALSAEQIKQARDYVNHKNYDFIMLPDWQSRMNIIFDMALSSLAARDEGIEAAAKILHEPWASAVRALKGGK